MVGDAPTPQRAVPAPLLVTAAVLAAELRASELNGDESPLLLDVRPAHLFAAGQIAGAVHVDVWGFSLIDTSPCALRAFSWMIHHVLELRGIRPDRAVVVCDQQSGIRAARVFWFLEYFGHEQVRVLDGGLDAWTREGLPLSTTPAEPVATEWPLATRPDRVADWRDVSAGLDRDDVVVLDTRTDEEHDGTLVRARRGGKIPGAVHVEWTRNLDAEGRFLALPLLRKVYEDAGVTPDREVIPYCQGAYRAAHAYLALRLLGYPRVRPYLGSWKEWGDRDDLPVERPVP